MNTVDLDLDALMKEPKKIRLNGQILEVKPPEVMELFEMHNIATQMKASMNNPELLPEMFEKFKSVFNKFIPELDKERISIDQLFSLMSFVTKMAIPSHIEELEKQGIKLDIDQKKIVSDSSESSQGSSDSTVDTPSQV